ncbi:hypothetical protein BD770DRAFT_446152 [Pilaira anomala]|nr:hypothetical protein BD770DRAFT_446152 [Pilaira anomala]
MTEDPNILTSFLKSFCQELTPQLRTATISFFVPEFRKHDLNHPTSIIHTMYKAFDHFRVRFKFSSVPLGTLLQLPPQAYVWNYLGPDLDLDETEDESLHQQFTKTFLWAKFESKNFRLHHYTAAKSKKFRISHKKLQSFWSSPMLLLARQVWPQISQFYQNQCFQVKYYTIISTIQYFIWTHFWKHTIDGAPFNLTNVKQTINRNIDILLNPIDSD